jgi:hypothetical protein
MFEEDGPVTWEIPASPRGRPTTRATGVEADGRWEVGGLHRSEDLGERPTAGPGGAKAARADTNLGGATWLAQRRQWTCHRN